MCVQSKVALQPHNVAVAAMNHFHDFGIREGAIELLHVRAQREHIDEEVLVTRADLHQTAEALREKKST